MKSHWNQDEKRRDWQLQHLGITQWVLRRPEVFQGEFAIKLPAQIDLLLVADPLPPADHPLVIDVARSIALMPAQLYGVTPEKVMTLPDRMCCHCWWLGLAAMRDFSGISFQTPPLATLLEDSVAKRELWNLID